QLRARARHRGLPGDGAAAATRWPDTDLVFVATSGHEIGHGGMEHFLHDGAPRPDATLAWAHFGASLACFGWGRGGGRWGTQRPGEPPPPPGGGPPGVGPPGVPSGGAARGGAGSPIARSPPASAWC